MHLNFMQNLFRSVMSVDISLVRTVKRYTALVTAADYSSDGKWIAILYGDNTVDV
jgi:hypothetical protein